MRRSQPIFAGVDVLAMALVVGCALVSFLIWRGEMVFIKGIQGSAWLRGYPWSALPICFLVALSALVSVPEIRQRAWRARAGFLLTMAVTNWFAFEISRRWFYSWPGKPAFVLNAEWLLASPPLSVLLVAFAHHHGLRRFAVKAGYRHLAIFVFALALILPLSWLTGAILQPYGGHQFDEVKAGYPVFWVNIMVGTACAMVGRLARHPPMAIARHE